MGLASSFVGFVQTQYEHLLQINHLGVINAHNILPQVCTATALLIFLSVCFRNWRAPSSRMKLPPSPPGNWPIIGHLHLLGRDPHISMAQLARKYGPLMFLQLGTKPHVVVSSPEMAREIFKYHDLNFSHRPHLAVKDLMDHMNQGFAFVPNNESWRKLRRIFTSELMSPKRRQQSQEIRAEETSNLLKAILHDVTASPGAPVGIFSRVERMVVDVLARIVLSRRFESSAESTSAKTSGVVTIDEFAHVSNETQFAQGAFFIGDFIPWLRWVDIGGSRRRAALMESRLQDIMTVILDQHRAKRRQSGNSHVDMDMLDVLLTHHEMQGDDSITEANIRGVIWDVFEAGTETTVSTAEWAMAHVLKDRKIHEKLRTELDSVVDVHRKVAEDNIPQLKYLQAVIKETFRLHTPTPLGAPHHSHEPCTVTGYHIPAYTSVILNSWAMGHDPAIWERPLEFSPERFLEEPLSRVDPASGQSFELLPFGSGRRICPAASMGVVTPQLVVASIVQGFDLSLAHEIDMEGTGGRLVVRMATPLQVLMKPRLPLDLY